MAHIVYVENDNVLLIQDLQDELTGEILTTLSQALLTLYDWRGQEVGGDAWPINMTHIGGDPKPGGSTWADGTWAAVLEATLDLTPGKHYTARVQMLASGDRDVVFEVALEAAQQRGV